MILLFKEILFFRDFIELAMPLGWPGSCYSNKAVTGENLIR